MTIRPLTSHLPSSPPAQDVRNPAQRREGVVGSASSVDRSHSIAAGEGGANVFAQGQDNVQKASNWRRALATMPTNTGLQQLSSTLQTGTHMSVPITGRPDTVHVGGGAGPSVSDGRSDGALPQAVPSGANFGDNIQEQTQGSERWSSERLTQTYEIGNASGAGMNCLLDTLSQLLQSQGRSSLNIGQYREILEAGGAARRGEQIDLIAPGSLQEGQQTAANILTQNFNIRLRVFTEQETPETGLTYWVSPLIGTNNGPVLDILQTAEPVPPFSSLLPRRSRRGGRQRR